MSLREKKTARKKAEILQSALTLLAKKGYHGTTMEDIASHLLMTKGALYYYFKDKQELVYESQIKIMNRSIENFKQINEMDATPTQKLEKIIQLHTEYLIENKAGFELMAKPDEIFTEQQLDEIYRLRDQYATHYDYLLQEGVDDGSFTIRDDEIKIARNLLLGAMNWVTQWYSPHGHKNVNEFVKAITRYAMRIVKNNDISDML